LGTQLQSALRTSKIISQRLFLKILPILKLMIMIKIDPYTNLLGHHILVYIKLHNGTTPLTIFLGA
jgi:hypothetical protein